MNPNLPLLALIALILVILGPIVVRVGFLVILRWVARIFLSAIGQKALDTLPDALDLKRRPAAAWRDPAAIEALARPLLARGFSDCGIHATEKMPGIMIWFLMKEDAAVAAFIYEHPKVPAPWIELSVRYEDGTTTALSTMPPTGIDQTPPFFRKMSADPGTPTDRLYERLLKERLARGIKQVTASTVIDEYELAYARIMAWQKNRGITPEEVAAVGKKWLAERGKKPDRAL